MRNPLRAGQVVRIATAFDKVEPDPPNVEFEMPSDISALTDEELSTAIGQAREAFEAIYGDDGSSVDSETLPTLNELTQAYESLRGERDKRAQRADEARGKAAELAERMRQDADPAPEAEAETEVEAEAEAEADSTEEEAPAEEVKEPVAASAEVKPVRVSVPRRAAVEPARQSPIRASIAVPGHQAGDEMNFDDVARAMLSLGGPRAVGRGRGKSFSQRQSVASIHRDYAPEAVVGDPASADAALRWARNQSRLPGGSLIAAGGWCAPSETIYDLCQLESRDGLLSLPEINATRGGVRNTLGPDFADIFDATGFCFTESQDEAGDYDPESPGDQGKPCQTIDCPEFTDTRLQVCGVCITGGNLMNRAYPELVRRYVEGAVTGHFHRVSGRMLSAIVDAATDVTVTDGDSDPGTAAPLLAAIELQVEDLRYRRRMSRSETLEAIFPYWAKGAIRADLSRRLGVDMLAVTDGAIINWFALRGVSVQWVYNFSDGGLGGDTAPTEWPSSVDFLLYPAGAWVSARTEVISLEMLYDSTLNATNDFTAIFTEEGWAVIETCPGTRHVTVPICVSGATQGGVDLVCSDS